MDRCTITNEPPPIEREPIPPGYSKLADGTLVELLPVGTRVRHASHERLTGRIHAIEWCRPGVPSALPYNIVWDDDREAVLRLGHLRMYNLPNGVVRIRP